MILYNEKVKQDFLSPEYVEKLKEAGIELKDAYYNIYRSDGSYYLEPVNWLHKIAEPDFGGVWEYICPTYTLSELLYKLDEYPCTEVELKTGKYKGQKVRLCGLKLFKDAPFYGYGYRLQLVSTGEEISSDEWFFYSEYPIYAAANLLIKCAKSGLYYVKDISDK